MKCCLLMASAITIAVLSTGCDRSTPQPVSSSRSAVADSASADSTADGNSAGKQTSDVKGLDSESRATKQAAEITGLDSESQTSIVPLDNDIKAPPLDAPESNSAPIPQVALETRPFATLQPVVSTDPVTLIEHLRQIDAALQDLVLAGSANFLSEKDFSDHGLRLGRMKQTAGAQLAQATTANDDQRKAGVIAQLVALSHMSGLRDIEAAKQLERLASELAGSADLDLSHQARVVLIGFELQSLQNGLHQQPDKLLSQVTELFTRPQDRGFPEFMVLQQAQQVLTQMGFTEASEKVRQTLINAYRTSPESQLRGEAWLVEVQASQAYLNFLQAFRSLGTEAFDSPAAFSAVRGLYQAFPTMQTLEQLATSIANIEYSGYVALSQDVAQFIQESLGAHTATDQTYVRNAISSHATRVGLLNSPVQFEGLVGFDGQPLDPTEYSGKVVLVDFWASWCLKCLREMPTIRQVHEEFAAQGLAILSINMDENLAIGSEFVQQQKFPWRSFHSADLNALGFQSPLARKLGVNAIPFMLLIDRQGRVAELHVRGTQLRPAVEKLIAAPN